MVLILPIQNLFNRIGKIFIMLNLIQFQVKISIGMPDRLFSIHGVEGMDKSLILKTRSAESCEWHARECHILSKKGTFIDKILQEWIQKRIHNPYQRCFCFSKRKFQRRKNWICICCYVSNRTGESSLSPISVTIL